MKSLNTPLRALIAVFCLVIVASTPLAGEAGHVLAENLVVPERGPAFDPLFPAALFQSYVAGMALVQENRVVYVPTREEVRVQDDWSARLQSVLLNNDILALYGKPGARNMGILGQYSLSHLDSVIAPFIRMYDDANGIRGVIPSLYIIYGTVWPEGEIGILSERVVREYIEFARERGWIVYLDHQIGKYTVEQAMNRLLPWLAYPNVHLALDPEWRTTKPMKEIGSVTASELNVAQTMMQEYLIEHRLPGRRMLVVHQFKPRMILDRPQVKSDYELVQIIHCADGFGSPSVKRNTYAFNALASNMPLKSFKLFLEPTIAGAGWDKPLMTPEEVLALDPRPYLIMYQ